MDHLPPPLQFEVREGLNQNVFYQSATQACAAVVTTSTRPRILLTFPAGNSGLGLWADPKLPDNQALQLEASGPLTEQGGAIRLTVHTNQAHLAFTQVELDSIRVIRDLDSPAEGDADKLRARYTDLLHGSPTWATPSVAPTGSTLTFTRTELNGRPWILRLILSPDTRVDWTDRTIVPGGHLKSPLRLVDPSGKPLEFTLEGQIPFSPLTPRRPEELLNAQALRLLPTGSPRFQDALRDLRMLAYHEKYLAGSWRFETYFGRDTLLSICMLSNTLTAAAFEDGLNSVLARLSPEGTVAHEEDVGAWAEVDELRAIDAGEPIAHPWETPRYDYKMVDSDFLLPLAEGQLSPDQLRTFLHGPHQVDVLRNWNRVVAQTSYDLVRLNPTMTVGSWRDSQMGLAGGPYPGDINITLAPGALRVIHEAMDTGAITRAEVLAAARQHHFFALLRAVEPGSTLFGSLLSYWTQARHQFEVHLSATEVRQRVEAYLQSLPADQQQALRQQTVLGGPTVDAFLHGATVPQWDGRLRFWALSLSAARQPLPVLNSDGVYRLFFDTPPPDELTDMITATRLPFPIGLMTDVGMVVANPAYSPSPQLWKTLGWDAYHGTVIWGWQHNMLVLGLLRQMHRFEHDPRQQALVTSMRKLLEELQTSETRAQGLVSSELWTWDVHNGHVVPLAFGVRGSSEDESNALQLWSAAWAGVWVARHP